MNEFYKYHEPVVHLATLLSIGLHIMILFLFLTSFILQLSYSLSLKLAKNAIISTFSQSAFLKSFF